jgi:hypothetical protein
MNARRKSAEGIVAAQAVKTRTVIGSSSTRISWVAIASQSTLAELARGGHGEAQQELGSRESPQWRDAL